MARVEALISRISHGTFQDPFDETSAKCNRHHYGSFGVSPKLRDSDLLRGILPTPGASPSGRTLTSTLRDPRKLLRLFPAETRTTPSTIGTNLNQIPPVRNWSEGRASRLATQHLSATCTRTDAPKHRVKMLLTPSRGQCAPAASGDMVLAFATWPITCGS
jgi:hypothetical protein